MPRNPNAINYSRNFPQSIKAFESLTDSRFPTGNLRHHFGEIIFMAYVAIVCGINSYEMMEEFCNVRKKWFQKYLSLPNGVPSYNTFSRVFEAINPKEFSACIIEQLKATTTTVKSSHVAIDGKAMRGTRDQDNKHINCVSAWACEQGFTLAQAFVDEKSNEITAIPELLAMLDLKDVVVSIDAMGTQTEIIKDIIHREGDYVVCVKKNQQLLFDEIADQFNYAQRQLMEDTNSLGEMWSYAQDEKKEHGRFTRRTTLVCHELHWMNQEIRSKWADLACVILVQREVWGKDGKFHKEISYYMSSLKESKAPEIQGYIRGHWKIENNCHWVIDTIFKEDHHQVKKKNAAKNWSTMRRISLNLWNSISSPKGAKKKSLPKRQLKAVADQDFLEQIIFSRM